MCHWCDPDAEPVEHPSKEFHDMWLYPHGRYGYTPSEKVDEGIMNCVWCSVPNKYEGLLAILENRDVIHSQDAGLQEDPRS
jgi:hypothetical protein